jgi:pyrroline-5-carboxylate reductase
MSGLPRLGFVGVGTIAEALITGMCAGGEQRATFLLSPRNADTAQRLADRFSFVAVAPDNQAVLDGSDIIFLAVRPQVAAEVLGALKFRQEQRIVSLIAGFDVARLRGLVAPAGTITRAAPMPAIAHRLGPVTLYPPVPEIAGLLEGLGQLIPLQNESELDAFWAVTGLMGSYFGLLDEIAGWLARRDLENEQVRPYVAAVFKALSVTAAERATEGFGRLAVDHSTPGGLNEQAYRELQAAGWTSLVSQALDLIHARILGRATLADRLPGAGKSA